MNCKPGDLAYVLPFAKTPGLAGRFVIVGEQFWSDGPFMLDGILFAGGRNAFICVAANGGVLPTQYDGSVKRRPIADDVLKPIRDPGNDAVDETLQWLPAPTIHSQIKADKSQEVAHG